MNTCGAVGIHYKRRGGCTRPGDGDVSDDLVNRAFDPEGPDRLWVMDVTEHRTGTGKVYLAVVVDAWSRMVVGWSIADHMRAELVADAVQMAVWRRALVIKVNPDAPQLVIRKLALAEGKILYLSVPHLRTEKCFIELDPQRLGTRVRFATTLAGACRYGRAVAPREMRPIDLVVCGSVAASRDGARVGKGGGYGDLEYGVRHDPPPVRRDKPRALARWRGCPRARRSPPPGRRPAR